MDSYDHLWPVMNVPVTGIHGSPIQKIRTRCVRNQDVASYRTISETLCRKSSASAGLANNMGVTSHKYFWIRYES